MFLNFQKNASNARSSGVTGLTPNDDKCHAIHNGSRTTPQRIQSKKPVQPVSSAAGHTAVDSRSGVVNQSSESTSTSSVQSSAVVPSTNGDDMVQPQEAAMQLSARNTFTPLTSSNFNPSNPPIDRDTQGNSPCPVTAQPTSSQRANAATTSELASGRPDASGCLHQTASAPHTSSQGMQPNSATFGSHSHSSSRSQSDRSIPEGLISSKNPDDHHGKPVSSNETSQISPLASTIQTETRTTAQQQQQQHQQQQWQQWYDARQGGRMGGISNLSSSSRPQQVTGQDDAGCIPTPGYAATQNLANYQETGAGNQVEGIYVHSYTPT